MRAQGLEIIEATVHKIVADRFVDPPRVTANMPSFCTITAGANA
jgi:hypothetical protein